MKNESIKSTKTSQENIQADLEGMKQRVVCISELDVILFVWLVLWKILVIALELISRSYSPPKMGQPVAIVSVKYRRVKIL